MEDLRAFNVPKAEVLRAPVRENMGLLNAHLRREARQQLGTLNSLTAAISAALSKEAGPALQAYSLTLRRAAGFKVKRTTPANTTYL